jgi:hypothetical protein
MKILKYEKMVVFPKSSIWKINSNRPEGIPKSFHGYIVSQFMYPAKPKLEFLDSLNIERRNNFKSSRRDTEIVS